MSIIDTHVSDDRHLSVIDTLHYPDLLEYTYNTFMHDCRRKIQWKAVPKTEQGKT